MLLGVGVVVDTAVVFGFGVVVVAAVAVDVAVIVRFAVAVNVGVTDFAFRVDVITKLIVDEFFFPTKKEWPCVSVKTLNLCWTLRWHQDRDK